MVKSMGKDKYRVRVSEEAYETLHKLSLMQNASMSKIANRLIAEELLFMQYKELFERGIRDEQENEEENLKI